MVLAGGFLRSVAFAVGAAVSWQEASFWAAPAAPLGAAALLAGSGSAADAEGLGGAAFLLAGLILGAELAGPGWALLAGLMVVGPAGWGSGALRAAWAAGALAGPAFCGWEQPASMASARAAPARQK